MAVRIKRQHDDRSRERIQTSQLINRLQWFALGQKDPQAKRVVEMTDTQVRAALGLLKKTLPDLAQTTSAVTHIHDTSEMSDAQLADIAAGRGTRTVATQDSAEEPSQVH